MSGAATWIGPAIVAAVISALVTGIGWFVSERQASRREAAQRRARTADMQTALLAEIRASRHRPSSLLDLRATIDRALDERPGQDLFVTRPTPPLILNAVLSDIHMLPEPVIDPVVLYYRQLSAIALLVDDLRSDRFYTLDDVKKATLYRDYVDLLIFADTLAAQAAEAIGRALNISAEGSSGLRSGAGRDGAAVPDEASRSNP